MPLTIEKTAQYLLDVNHPGVSAAALLQTLDMTILKRLKSDVHLLHHILYDGFGQSSIRSKPADKPLIARAEFLLEELMLRYLKRLDNEGILRPTLALFEHSIIYRRQVERFRIKIDELAKLKGFEAICNNANQLQDNQADLLRSIYTMTEAPRILKSNLGRKIKELVAPDPIRDSTSQGRADPFNIPMFESYAAARREAEELLSRMDNRELSLRLLKALSETNTAQYDISTPVYGTGTIYAYIPAIIERLHGDLYPRNLIFITDLKEMINNAISEVKKISNRIERLQGTSPAL